MKPLDYNFGTSDSGMLYKTLKETIPLCKINIWKSLCKELYLIIRNSLDGILTDGGGRSNTRSWCWSWLCWRLAILIFIFHHLYFLLETLLEKEKYRFLEKCQFTLIGYSAIFKLFLTAGFYDTFQILPGFRPESSYLLLRLTFNGRALSSWSVFRRYFWLSGWMMR